MTTTSRFMVPLPDNAAATFCSRACGSYWCATAGRTSDDVRFEELDAPPTCRHCAWCAKQLPSSLVCTWHGEDCPEYRWEVTFAGKAAVRELMKRAKVDDLAPEERDAAVARMWDCLEYVWDHQDVPDPVTAVHEVWSRRDVWLTPTT